MKSLLKWLLFIVVIFVLVVMYRAIVDAHYVPEDDAFKMRIEQFNYEAADASFENIERFLNEYHAVLSTLFENSNAEGIYGAGKMIYVDTLRIKAPAYITGQYRVFSWEHRALGLANSLLSVEGYLLFSREYISRLKLDNARLRNRPVEVTRRLKSEHKRAKEDLDLFLRNESWSD